MAVCRRDLILAGLSGLAAAGLAACDRGPGGAASFKAVDITGAEYGRDFELSDADGKPRRLADFKGQLVVVFFGFTHCPDVCPATMLELATVKKALGADGARVQGIFVTIDPERDTAALLKDYVANFDPSFVALRGTADETKAAAKQFKIFYAKVPGKTDSSYTMDHTAGSYIFDAKGQVRLFTRYGTGAPALVHDLKLLLAAAP